MVNEQEELAASVKGLRAYWMRRKRRKIWNDEVAEWCLLARGSYLKRFEAILVLARVQSHQDEPAIETVAQE